MTTKTIIRTLCLLLCMAIAPNLGAQELEEPYLMWESILLTPDYEELADLQKGMSAHNKKFHTEGPNAVTVFNIVTGPNAGKLVWVMGPMMFRHNDERPQDKAHDADWRDNVMPYIEDLETVEYWRKDAKIEVPFASENTSPGDYPLLMVRYHEVNPGKGYAMQRLFGQIADAIKSMEMDSPWGVYYNEFRQGYTIGRHIATIGFFKNWTELDRDVNFREYFEKTHGDNAWQPFVDEMDATFSNSWDEIWQYNADLSGK